MRIALLTAAAAFISMSTAHAVEPFNPQPDPPGRHRASDFNPQPDPPGRHHVQRHRLCRNDHGRVIPCRRPG